MSDLLCMIITAVIGIGVVLLIYHAQDNNDNWWDDF
mgnify:CR=1 FL=1